MDRVNHSRSYTMDTFPIVKVIILISKNNEVESWPIVKVIIESSTPCRKILIVEPFLNIL